MQRLLATALAAAMTAAAVLVGCAEPQETGAASPVPSASPAPTPRPQATLELVRETAFSDLPADDPDHDAAAYAACLGLMEGGADGTWSPGLSVDRAGAAAVLYRLSGASERPYAAAFADVEPESWYAPAVTWAAEEGILSGRDDGLFHPLDPITRGELALLLYRYAGTRGMDTAPRPDQLESYWDGGRAPEGAREALNWCLYNGLFAPIVSREILPDYPVTRAQLAQVLTAWQAGSDPVAKALYGARLDSLASRSQASHDQLQARIQTAAQSYGAVGLQVAVIEGGRVTDSFVYGRANRTQYEILDANTGANIIVDAGAMTRDHKIRVASLSKVVLAMNVMALAEEGSLDLDGSIGRYWGCAAQNRAYPDVPVSIRSILSHTSSIPLYAGESADSYDRVYQRLADGAFSSLRPGDLRAWGYNNYAFNVLGMTLELAQGRRYDDVANERFFLPLGIEAGISPGSLEHTELLSDLFLHGGGVGRSVREQLLIRDDYGVGDRGIYFAGGLTISAVDLAKLWAVLAGDGVYEGRRLLSAASVEAMETSLGAPSGQVFEQCFPLRLQYDLYGRGRIYYHTGSAYGVYALASYDPDTGDGAVVLTTGASGVKDSRDIYAVCGQITQAVYGVLADQSAELQDPAQADPDVGLYVYDGQSGEIVEYADDVKALVKE